MTLLPISPVTDAFTRGLALEVALISSTERVIGVLVALIVRTAWTLRSNNGTEFVATAV